MDDCGLSGELSLRRWRLLLRGWARRNEKMAGCAHDAGSQERANSPLQDRFPRQRGCFLVDGEKHSQGELDLQDAATPFEKTRTNSSSPISILLEKRNSRARADLFGAGAGHRDGI